LFSDASDLARERLAVGVWSIEGAFRLRTLRSFSFSAGFTVLIEGRKPNDRDSAEANLLVDSELRLDKLLESRGVPKGCSPVYDRDGTSSPLFWFRLFLEKKEAGVLEVWLRDGRGMPLDGAVDLDSAGCVSWAEPGSPLGLGI
jgi:hypothetical protein